MSDSFVEKLALVVAEEILDQGGFMNPAAQELRLSRR